MQRPTVLLEVLKVLGIRESVQVILLSMYYEEKLAITETTELLFQLFLSNKETEMIAATK